MIVSGGGVGGEKRQKRKVVSKCPPVSWETYPLENLNRKGVYCARKNTPKRYVMVMKSCAVDDAFQEQGDEEKDINGEDDVNKACGGLRQSQAPLDDHLRV
jgi:hypothetical protein